MIMTQIVFVALWRLRLIFFSSVLWLRAFLAGFSLLCFTLRLCFFCLLCHVLLGFSASELAVVPRVFVYLLHLAKYFLWRAHNANRFRDVQPGALPLVEVIKARAKCHLYILFKRFRSSHRQRYFQRLGSKWRFWESVRGFILLSSLA